MSLKLAREAAFKALFQLEFAESNEEEKKFYEDLSIEIATDELENLSEHDLELLEDKVRGTRAHLKEIDEMIQENLKKGWTLKRLATADRNILRLAVYEMKFAEEKLTANIAINEAVNLAKKYGTDESGRFVNGILDAISK